MCRCQEKKKCECYDYVIVGLGTSGSVLARYLSDNFANKVLVLEAGENRSEDPIVNAGVFGLNQTELAYNPKYSLTKANAETNPILGNFPNVIFSAGRMWFGSSGHNFLLANRGSSDRWDDLVSITGDAQWSYTNLVPYFKFLETFNGVSQEAALRGDAGPLQVSQLPNIPNSLADAVALATNTPQVDDYNVPTGNLSVAPAQLFDDPTFTFRSYGKDFLPASILGPDGRGIGGRQLTVKSGSHVTRILFKGTKAIGVQYVQRGCTKTCYAKKKVILCAGSPFSSQILQLSGIGDPAILGDPFVQIPVKVANPLVGTGFKTHYGPLLVATTSEEQQPPLPVVAFVDGAPYYTPPPGEPQNIRREHLNFFPPVYSAPSGILSAANIEPFDFGVFGFAWNLRPRSSGTAYIIDNNPLTMPDIRFNLYSDGDLTDVSSDLSMSVAMLKTMRDSVTTNGMNGTVVYPPPEHFDSDDSLAFDSGAAVNFSGTSVTNHYSGTCNMGTDISNGVVSGTDLHVFGVQNLMVADNSIFPFPASGNTCFQAYIAGIIAAKILGAVIL